MMSSSNLLLMSPESFVSVLVSMASLLEDVIEKISPWVSCRS